MQSRAGGRHNEKSNPTTADSIKVENGFLRKTIFEAMSIRTDEITQQPMRRSALSLKKYIAQKTIGDKARR